MNMMNRLLNRQNLISLGLFAVFFHAAISLLQYFIDIQGILIADYIILGLTSSAAILFFAKEQLPVRFQFAQVLLILFIIWFIISCVSMSVKYNNDWVTYNSFSIMSTAVSLLLAFPLGYVLIREGGNKTGTILLHILLLTWTVFIIFVLASVFQGNAISTPNGGTISMKKSLRLNCNRNTTGSWELMFFLGCVCMMLRCKQLPLKIVYGISSAVHYAALTLSNSRASILATTVGFMALVGIAVYLRLEKTGKPRRLLFSVIAALAAGAAFYFLSGLIIKLYNSSTSSSVSNRVGITGDTTLHGRTTIWKHSIAGIFSSFRAAMFGVTPASTIEMITQMSGGKIHNMYTHNQFLEIAAGIGIPGLCLFLAWFFIMLKDMYKLFFVQKDRTFFLLIPVLILSIMLMNMAEALLVFMYHISGFAFFLLCGILHGRVNKPAEAGRLFRPRA